MGIYRRWSVKYSIVQAGQQMEGEPIEEYFRTHAEMVAWVKRMTSDVLASGQKIYLSLHLL